MESSRALMAFRWRYGIPSVQLHRHRPLPRAGLGAARASDLNKGGDRRAGGHCRAADQAPADADLLMADSKKEPGEEKPAKPPDKKCQSARAARLARSGRCIKWTSGRRRHQRHPAEFGAIGSARWSEGDKYLPRRGCIFSVTVVSRRGARIRASSIRDDEFASKGWPLKADDAILRAVLRPAATNSQDIARTCPRASWCPNCPTSPCVWSRRTRPPWSMQARPDRPPVSPRPSSWAGIPIRHLRGASDEASRFFHCGLPGFLRFAAMTWALCDGLKYD